MNMNVVPGYYIRIHVPTLAWHDSSATVFLSFVAGLEVKGKARSEDSIKMYCRSSSAELASAFRDQKDWNSHYYACRQPDEQQFDLREHR